MNRLLLAPVLIFGASISFTGCNSNDASGQGQAQAATDKPASDRADGEPKSKANKLPGTKGPLFEYVGKKGPKVISADVYSDPKAVRDKSPKGRLLPSGVKELRFQLTFEKEPAPEFKMTTTIYNDSGKVETKNSGNLGFSRNLQSGELLLLFDASLKDGTFPNGVYQARIDVDGEIVAHINWEIAPAKK
jgi:hypothetical protein